MNDHRYTLVYRNEDGTTISQRLWTLEEAQRRVTILNRAEAPDYGRWSIHELTEVQP